MILKAFCLLDVKSGHFNTPFFSLHRADAVRSVIDVAQDMRTTVGRHPADFALCELGSFDDQTGTFEHKVPEQIGLVVSFLDAERKAQPELYQLGRDADQTALAGEG